MDDRSLILSKLEDIEKLLKEIEDNTHPNRGNRSNFRHNRQEKVGLEMSSLRDSYLQICFYTTVVRAVDYSKRLPKKKRGMKSGPNYRPNHVALLKLIIFIFSSFKTINTMVGCCSSIPN